MTDSKYMRQTVPSREAIRSKLIADLDYFLEERDVALLGLLVDMDQTDGDHHKQWYLDQCVRLLLGESYGLWVDRRDWDEGTAP